MNSSSDLNFDDIVSSSDNPIIPEVDLIFAISSTASSSPANYNQMKSIIKSVIDKYGMMKINYGFITFGSQPVTDSRLTEYFSSESSLKDFVDFLIRRSGVALHKALEEAKKAFEDSTRPDAKKVSALYHASDSAFAF